MPLFSVWEHAKHTCSVNHNSLINMDDNSVYWITEKQFQKEYISRVFSLAYLSIKLPLSRVKRWVFFMSANPLAPGSSHPCGSQFSSHSERGDDVRLVFCSPSVFTFSPLRQNCGNPVILAQPETRPWKSSLWSCTGEERQQVIVAERAGGTWALLHSWFERERAVNKFGRVSEGEY